MDQSTTINSQMQIRQHWLKVGSSSTHRIKFLVVQGANQTDATPKIYFYGIRAIASGRQVTSNLLRI